jgi:hypothetical protein
VQASGVAVTFNNTEKVVEALSHGVALVDRSHWGRLRVAGGDRLSLLHNQSTADFKQLTAGQGCDTVSEATSSCCFWRVVRCVGVLGLLRAVSGLYLLHSQLTADSNQLSSDSRRRVRYGTQLFRCIKVSAQARCLDLATGQQPSFWTAASCCWCHPNGPKASQLHMAFHQSAADITAVSDKQL